MLKLILYVTVLLFASCGQNNNQSIRTEGEPSQKEEQTEIALKFINSYVENLNKGNQSINIIEWVNSNAQTTEEFKIELKRILDKAKHDDPEMGLDADPILDAQDNPESFVLDSFDEKTNYLTVRGKEWPEFKVIIKLKFQNNKWFVDGSGIVNMKLPPPPKAPADYMIIQDGKKYEMSKEEFEKYQDSLNNQSLIE